MAVARAGYPITPLVVNAPTPNSGEIAAIRGDVIMAMPAVAHVARVRGEQDRRLELAGVHVVVAAADDAGSPTPPTSARR